MRSMLMRRNTNARRKGVELRLIAWIILRSIGRGTNRNQKKQEDFFNSTSLICKPNFNYSSKLCFYLMQVTSPSSQFEWYCVECVRQLSSRKNMHRVKARDVERERIHRRASERSRSFHQEKKPTIHFTKICPLYTP